MANLFNLFGKKKEISPKIVPIDVIQSLKETLSTQEKRETFLEKRIQLLRDEAKANIKNKPKALFALKKSKTLEKQIGVIYGIKQNLENQIMVLEQSINNKNVVDTMKKSKTVLTQITKDLDPDETAEIMDDITEKIEESEEISNLLSNPIGPKYDDAELLAELDEMNEVDKMLSVPALPKAIVHIKTYEEELAELEREFGHFPEVPTGAPGFSKGEVLTS